jgi:hypothetical protein
MTKELDVSFDPSEETTFTTRIGVADGNIVILFGQKINWLALTPVSAREFASGLIEAAETAEALKTKKLN